MALSLKQLQAVECLDNCLVLACPGSGKTTVLVNKVIYILENDPGARIMIVSFTADSASEFRHRLIKGLAKSFGMAKATEIVSKNIITGTFHAIALDQLQRAIKQSGGKKPTIIGDGQMRQYIERALQESKIEGLDYETAVAHIETSKQNPDYEPDNDKYGQLFVAYTEITERNNVIDFSDMLFRTVRLMRSGEIKPKSVHYLLTDESQDLDEMQYAWCKEHILNGSIVTVVGDDDQSIYKFRRALGYKGMMRFHDEFGAKIIKLDTNYRSLGMVIDSAAKVIEYNQERVKKNLEAARGPGGSVEIFKCNKEAIECELIVNKIFEISGERQDSNLPDRYLVSLQKDEWAVLARNNHNLRKLQLTFDVWGVPYKSNGRNLWNERPICFAIGLLSSILTKKKAGFDAALHYAGMDESVLIRLHNDYGDEFSQVFLKGAEKEWDKYGKGTAESLRQFAAKVPLWDAMLLKDDDKGNHHVNNLIRSVFGWFIENMNANTSDDNKNKSSFQRDQDMLGFAMDLMAKMKGSLSSRLSKIMEGKNTKDELGKEGKVVHKVTVGTLHSSKGLEFDNVWILGADNGVIPTNDPEEWSPEIHEEERRLFYVGMTRAKNRVFLSFQKEPSPYILETDLPISEVVLAES